MINSQVNTRKDGLVGHLGLRLKTKSNSTFHGHRVVVESANSVNMKFYSPCEIYF